MKLRADVKCYYCGYVSGEAIAEAASSSAPMTILHADATAAAHGERGSLRCQRCGGPTYLEEITVVRERKPVRNLVPADFAPRRGRPPKRFSTGAA